MATLPRQTQAWTPPPARVEGERLLRAKAAEQRAAEALAEARKLAAEAKQEDQSVKEELADLKKQIAALMADLPKIMPGGAGKRTIGKVLERDFIAPGRLISDENVGQVVDERLEEAAPTLLDRDNHTGTQPAATISDFTSAADARVVGALLDWTGGATGSDPASIIEQLGDLVVNVARYCSRDENADCHAGLQRAFNAAEGKILWFPKRRYRSATRPAGAGNTTGALRLPNKCIILAAPGAYIDCSGWANSGSVKYLLYASGTFDAPINLASNGANKATSITLTDASSIQKGDDLVIVSNAFFTTEDGSLGTKGEWVKVEGKSGNTLQLAGRLRDSYNTADVARIHRLSNPVQIIIDGLAVKGPGQFTGGAAGDRGIWIENGVDCFMRNVEVAYSDQLSITFHNILNGGIDGAKVAFDPKGGDVNQYGPMFSALCENVHFRRLDVTNGKEASGLTSSGGIAAIKPVGVTRDCSITFSRFRGAWRSGCSTHDSHTGFEFSHNVVEDCEQGVDNRIVGGTYKGNTFRRLGVDTGSLDCAFQLGSGAGKVLIEGNTIEDALRGVHMGDSTVHETIPGDIEIIDNTMRLIRGHGVRIENTKTSTAALGTVIVQGNRIAGDGSAVIRGVEIEGKWKPVVVDNTIRDGNGGRPIYLHATDNGAGMNGPVNPVVTDNKWDSGFTTPLIQHASGRFTVERNSQIDATALPSAASASALTVPTDGNIFNVTGTTTINTVANAAAYVGKEITLIFAASLTVTHNSGGAGAANTIQLNGAVNFAATANDTLTLASNGTVWLEKSRAVI